MAGIIDGHVHDLLSQAEERLRASSSTVNTIAKTALPKEKEDGIPTPPAPRSKEDLNIRNPQQKALKHAQKDTAGSDWFNLPKTDVTPELKRDWQLLRMRNILDPKSQKKTLRPTLPVYSQVGEVIAGPTEFYSARLTKKERRRTMLEEVMSSHDSTKLQTRYAGVQRTKSSGKKAFYEKLKLQRRNRKN